MAVFSLDNLRAAADKRYASTVIEADGKKFIFPNLLRMSKGARNQVTDILAKAEAYAGNESVDEIDEQFDMFVELVRIAEVNGRGDELLELIGDDSAIILDIVTKWLETAQVGEA